MADPTAAPGSVVVNPADLAGGDTTGRRRHPSETKHAFRFERSKYITLKGFAIRGATGSAVVLVGGSAANSDITLDSNDIYDTGLSCGNCGAIAIQLGNLRTWVVNNAVHHNGRNGLWDDTDDATGSCSTGSNWGPTHIVNNTFFANGWSGIRLCPAHQAHLINNLMVGNGVAPSPPVAAGQRWGLKVEDDGADGGAGSPQHVTLINNIFYNNGMFLKEGPGSPPMKGGDIANVAWTLDSTDNGNWTTTGAEGPDADGAMPAAGIAGAVGATSYSDIFVNPTSWDFHLADRSPAIDRGVNSFSHDGKEWVPIVDFEGETRPIDGDAQAGAITDAGFDEVVPPLQVTALAVPTSGPVPLAVIFDAEVVGNIAEYAWDFDGNGVYDWSSSMSPQTAHTYRDVGTFSATIRVTDNAGRTATDSIVIATEPGLEAIARANPTRGPRPLRVTFTPSGVSTGPPILWYRWDYNGDGVYDTGNMPRPDPTTFTYFTAGTFQATLRVEDATGRTATDSVEIIVENVPPSVTASVSPTNGPAPLTVNFNGSATSPNGAIVLYEWDFDGDGTSDYSSSSSGNTTHTFDTPGTRQPVFRVTDAIGLTATVANFLIEVRVGPPQSPTAVASVSPLQGNAPLNVNLGCAGSSDPDGSIVLYEWDFEYDGAFSADFSSPSTCNTSHIYTAGGLHYVALRVTDNDGLTGIDVKAVVVNIAVALTVLDDTFNPHSGEVTTVRTTLSADALVHVYLRNRFGALSRTLFQGPRPAGTYNDPWDGNDNSGNVLVDADYYAYIDYTVGGVINTKPDQPSGNLQYQATYTENISNGGAIAPWNDVFWEMIFRTVSQGASEVTLSITPYSVGNVIVAEPLNREPFGAGTYSAFWEGLTSTGQYITDSNLDVGSGGDFLWAAFGYTLPDNAIVIEGGRPVISSPAATPNYVRSPDSPACIGSAGTDIGFTLSKEAAPRLRVFSMNTGALVAQVLTGLLSPGTQTVNWNGRSISGEFVETGNYYVEITATAADGNISRPRRVLVQVWY